MSTKGTKGKQNNDTSDYWSGKIATNDKNVKYFIEPFTPLPKGMYPLIPIVKKTALWKEQELARIKEEAEEDDKREEAMIDINKLKSNFKIIGS